MELSELLLPESSADRSRALDAMEARVAWLAFGQAVVDELRLCSFCEPAELVDLKPSVRMADLLSS